MQQKHTHTYSRHWQRTANIEAIIILSMHLTTFQYRFSIIVQCLNGAVLTLAFAAALVWTIITINEATNHFAVYVFLLDMYLVWLV